jgi:hypothetical protein
MKKSTAIFLLVVALVSCHNNEDFIETLPSCTNDTIFTHFPIDMDYVISFEPLGHYNPPGHVFPTDHHYFNIRRGEGNVDIFAPCDGWITTVFEYAAQGELQREYAFEIYACREVWVKYGHISRLEDFILDELGEPDLEDTYTTGGVTYHTKNFKTEIKVEAGQKIGRLLDIEYVSGMDFGTFDLRQKLPFVNLSRWGNYGYFNTVSFLNYASQEVRTRIYNLIQFENEGLPLRTTPPLEGQVCYDVQGTAQGLWFVPGKDKYPEDPHLALIRNNFFPEKNVISMGTSVPGLEPIPYEFYPEHSGTHNRSFDEITADGKIYSFDSFTNFSNGPLEEFHFSHDKIILIQLVDELTLKIEVQDKSNGPPWVFGPNAVVFKR